MLVFCFHGTQFKYHFGLWEGIDGQIKGMSFYTPCEPCCALASVRIEKTECEHSLPNKHSESAQRLTVVVRGQPARRYFVIKSVSCGQCACINGVTDFCAACQKMPLNL
jgi:hypothetical protein